MHPTGIKKTLQHRGSLHYKRLLSPFPAGPASLLALSITSTLTSSCNTMHKSSTGFEGAFQFSKEHDVTEDNAYGSQPALKQKVTMIPTRMIIPTKMAIFRQALLIATLLNLTHRSRVSTEHKLNNFEQSAVTSFFGLVLSLSLQQNRTCCCVPGSPDTFLAAWTQHCRVADGLSGHKATTQSHDQCFPRASVSFCEWPVDVGTYLDPLSPYRGLLYLDIAPWPYPVQLPLTYVQF